MNKFYVGAISIGNAIDQGLDASCTKATIEEAIEDAKRKIAKGECETAVVVQIVRIIRKDFPPMTIEVVD